MSADLNQLDHVVIAAPDLAAAKAQFAAMTGTQPVDGGPHIGRGTCNALVSFGASCYLEIIAPDPQQDIAGTGGAALAELSEPVLLHWAVRVSDLGAIADAANSLGLTAGAAYDMSRATPGGARLNWRLMAIGGHGLGGLVPFYIDWLDCAHPADAAPVVGPLEELAVSVTNPAIVELLVPTQGVEVAHGSPLLSLRFASAKGEICYASSAPLGF